MSPSPIIAIASHKGGTGRSTVALALANLWGASGRRVTLVESSDAPTLSPVVNTTDGKSGWENVRVVKWSAPSESLPDVGEVDAVILDCPPLTFTTAQAWLGHATALIVTCLADPLAMRSMRMATEAIADAREKNPKLALLGIVLNQVRADDPVQADLQRLVQAQSHLPLNRSIPDDPAIRSWMRSGGHPLPDGPARTVFVEWTEALAVSVGLASASSPVEAAATPIEAPAPAPVEPPVLVATPAEVPETPPLAERETVVLTYPQSDSEAPSAPLPTVRLTPAGKSGPSLEPPAVPQEATPLPAALPAISKAASSGTLPSIVKRSAASSKTLPAVPTQSPSKAAMKTVVIPKPHSPEADAAEGIETAVPIDEPLRRGSTTQKIEPPPDILAARAQEAKAEEDLRRRAEAAVRRREAGPSSVQLPAVQLMRAATSQPEQDGWVTRIFRSVFKRNP